MIPMAIFIPATPVYPHIHNWLLYVLVLVLASLLAGALGLAIGASVSPRHIGLVFSIIVVPITFLGCVYYPWSGLDKIRWLQIAVLFNPRSRVYQRGAARDRHARCETHARLGNFVGIDILFC